MKPHLKKFNEIKHLLQLKLGERVRCFYEDGTEFLELENSDFWLSVDKNEFTVGIGLNHTHFSEDYDNLERGIIQTFDLLTNKVKITKFIKGDTIFKMVTEIEYLNNEIMNIGETGILFFPFWKKTRVETYYLKKEIEKIEIEDEVNKIINS